MNLSCRPWCLPHWRGRLSGPDAAALWFKGSDAPETNVPPCEYFGGWHGSLESIETLCARDLVTRVHCNM